MGPASLERWLQVFLLPKSTLDFFIYLIAVDPSILTWSIFFPSDLIEMFSCGVPEPEVNYLLDFIPVILNPARFPGVMLREFIFVILAVRFLAPYLEAQVNLTDVKIAAMVETVIVALVVDFCNWDLSIHKE